MKAAVEIQVQSRNGVGKGAARAIRRSGFVPVNVYANGKANVNLTVEARVISNEYFRGGFMNKIVALKGECKDIFAFPRDVQLNPVTDKIEHADFLAVDETSTVKVWVPVHILNADKSIGVKRGGALNVVSHRVELLCPVANIPTSIDVDVSTLDIGSSIHLAGIELPKGVSQAARGRTITIASIAGRQKDEEPAAGASTTAAGAVPASTAKAPAAGAAADAKKPAAKK